MDKQKAHLKKLLTALGVESPDAVLLELFPADDTEPTLDVDALLTQAQAYAKPFLEEEIRIAEKKNFKIQYDKDLLGKLAQSSGGLITTKEATELNDVKKVTDLLTARIKESTGKSDEDKEKMIAALNEKVEALELEKTTEVEKVRGEYQAKEEGRTISEKALMLMGKKALAVNPAVASKGVLSALGEKYVVKFNEATDKFELYDKADPTKKAKKNDTAFASFDEEADAVIKDYNWLAQSKGGGANTLPVPGKVGQQQQQPEIKRSKLGAIMQNAGEGAE